MSAFIVKFDTDNDAFEGAGRDYEIARILRAMADRIEDHGCPTAPAIVRDVNGNNIGRFCLSNDPE